MGSGPGKSVGDVTRPLATNRSATRETSRAPAPARVPALPKAVMPASSASISARADGERAADPATAFPSTVFPEIRAAARHEGQPLGAETQSRLGTALGTGFDDVRIHMGERAARAADALQARAYTIGNDIVFGAGEYAPGSASGERLLAHELTHVAQPGAPRTQAVSREGDASEREADHAADAVMHGASVRPQVAATAEVQRDPKPDADKKPDADNKPTLPLMDRMFDDASPFLAASIGSTTISNFDTGKADLKPAHLLELKKNAHSITLLLKQYPQSLVHVIGHTDTVGTEENNLTLGQARADATADALGKLGVPSTILDATSVGEASPQAVKTKDETPSAQNRRVEIRFEPKADIAINPPPKLEPDPPKKDPGPVVTPDPPPIDLTYKPGTDSGWKGPPYRRPDDSNPAWYKPDPPPIKGTEPKSVIDVIGEKVIDPVVDRVAGKLSKDKRDKIKQGARDAVATGAAKLARTAAENAGVTDSQALDAIEKATEAAIKEKGGKPP